MSNHPPFVTFGIYTINLNYVTAYIKGFNTEDTVTLFIREGAEFPGCIDGRIDVSLQIWESFFKN